MLVQVNIHRKIIQFVRKRTLAVYPPVNGIGGMPRIMREYLSGTPRRSEQNTLLLQLVQRLHQRTHQTGFSRTGIAFQEENFV